MQFYAPVKGNIHGMVLAGEILSILGETLGGGAPGDEGHRVACELESV